MFEKSFLKKVKLSFLITLSTLVLLGCGGEDTPSSSGGSTPPSNNGGTNPSDNGGNTLTAPNSTLGNLELGAVKGASVTIYTLDESYTL